jgi:hypothetical protein
MACAAGSGKIFGIWEETVEMNTCLSDQEETRGTRTRESDLRRSSSWGYVEDRRHGLGVKAGPQLHRRGLASTFVEGRQVTGVRTAIQQPQTSIIYLRLPDAGSSSGQCHGAASRRRHMWEGQRPLERNERRRIWEEVQSTGRPMPLSRSRKRAAASMGEKFHHLRELGERPSKVICGPEPCSFWCILKCVKKRV